MTVWRIDVDETRYAAHGLHDLSDARHTDLKWALDALGSDLGMSVLRMAMLHGVLSRPDQGPWTEVCDLAVGTHAALERLYLPHPGLRHIGALIRRDRGRMCVDEGGRQSVLLRCGWAGQEVTDFVLDTLWCLPNYRFGHSDADVAARLSRAIDAELDVFRFRFARYLLMRLVMRNYRSIKAHLYREGGRLRRAVQADANNAEIEGRDGDRTRKKRKLAAGTA